MTPQEVCLGMRVRVGEHHRIAERRGLVGRVVGSYGGDDYVALEVRLSDGECRLFWPGDLEEISSHHRPLLGGVPEGLGQREVSTKELLFPSFEYYLDESDPDVAILRRQDGAFVAAFSARGATTEGITEAAKEDYRELVRIHWARSGESAEEHRSA